MTLRLYADRRQIALAGVEVTLEFDRVHADDCVDCEERGDGLIERVRTEVTIHGELSHRPACAARPGGATVPRAQDPGTGRALRRCGDVRRPRGVIGPQDPRRAAFGAWQPRVEGPLSERDSMDEAGIAKPRAACRPAGACAPGAATAPSELRSHCGRVAPCTGGRAAPTAHHVSRSNRT